MTEDTIKRRARGLDRAFDILDFLKEIGQPLRPNEIASGIGSPKSTVYELVASLLERRILEPVGKDGHVPRPSVVLPRTDAKNNYNDYRRVLIDSANSLARRINE